MPHPGEIMQIELRNSSQALYRRTLLAHLPRMILESPAFQLWVKDVPPKYRAAMLAVEIASSIVYRGGFERHFEEDLKDYVARMFAPAPETGSRLPERIQSTSRKARSRPIK